MQGNFFKKIFSTFVNMRPHLDFAGIIYDEPDNLNLCNKIDTFQYNAGLAITGVVRGSSKKDCTRN